MRLLLGCAWLIAIAFPVCGVAYAATEAADARAAISDSTIIGAMSVVIGALLGLWLRTQNRDIAEAKQIALKALNRIDNLEDQLLKDYEPALKFARQVESMLLPLKQQLEGMSREWDRIKDRLFFTPPPPGRERA